jgi:hypothetical protein
VILLALIGCCLFASGCGSDSDGYTAKDRATQLAARIEEKNLGHSEHASKVKCVFESDAGNGRAWYVCGPHGFYIACDKRTTDKPLGPPRTSDGAEWGDCLAD